LNNFVSAHLLDESCLLQTDPTEAKSAGDLPCVIRDIPPGIDMQAYWSSYLRRTGVLSRNHIAYQHEAVMTPSALRAVMGATSNAEVVNWDRFPDLKDFASELFNDIPQESYRLLWGTWSRSAFRHSQHIPFETQFLPPIALQSTTLGFPLSSNVPVRASKFRNINRALCCECE
jgi:hypothetical protein